MISARAAAAPGKEAPAQNHVFLQINEIMNPANENHVFLQINGIMNPANVVSRVAN